MTDLRDDASTHHPTGLQRWFAEMRRRRVFRAIGVYGAAALLVLEAADLIFPLIPLPAWTVSLVFWLALLGFPPAVILAWAFELTPSGVQATGPAEPEELRAIADEPGIARWRGLLFAVAGIVLLGIGFLGGLRTSDIPTETAPAYTERPTIAVLPFSDLSPDGDQEYFSHGISEEILRALSRIRGLRVAARSSALSYRVSDQDMREIGAELGVAYLLAGSVRRQGEQVRISAELVDASDGFRVWSDTFERTLDDIFEIQTEIASAIASELRVPLGLGSGELLAATASSQAHDLYLAGRAALRRRGSGVREAVELFGRAVELDSAWSPAWAALAEAHATLPLYAGPRGESTDSAFWATHLAAGEAAARRALELDPRNTSARVALGVVHRDRWEWREAEAQLRRVVASDPDNGEAHVQYSELLWGMGRLDESLLEARRALGLDRTPVRLDIVGFILYQSRRYQEAETYLEEGLALDPAGEVHFLRTVLGRQLLFTGREREAADRFASYFSDPEGIRMQAAALEANDPSLLPDDPSRVLPQTWQLLGFPERAVEALELLVTRIPFRVPFEIWDPVFEPLHGTAEFDQILRRVNLEGAEVRYPAPDG